MASAVNQNVNGHAAVDLTDKDSPKGDASKETSENNSPPGASRAIVHGAIVIVMLFWRPHPENPLIFFAIAGLWGVGDAVWQTQINGLYGLLFRRNKEAAFSNYRLWESAGFVIAYAYSTTLCARMKLYILFGNLTLGVLGYIIVEIRYRRKKQESKKNARQADLAKQQANQIEETDDEHDDLEEDIEITHF